MSNLSFYTELSVGIVNAWILAFGAILAQIIFMMLSREGGKRAADVSWYNSADKRNALLSSLFQVVILVLSIFIPLKVGTTWFVVGISIFAVAMIAYAFTLYAYATAPENAAITQGMYAISRNPMYLCFQVAMFGVCIASASIWLLVAMIPFNIFTHLLILGEERYCIETYGESYLNYKEKTPRYFLVF